VDAELIGGLTALEWSVESADAAHRHRDVSPRMFVRGVIEGLRGCIRGLDQILAGVESADSRDLDGVVELAARARWEMRDGVLELQSKLCSRPEPETLVRAQAATRSMAATAAALRHLLRTDVGRVGLERPPAWRVEFGDASHRRSDEGPMRPWLQSASADAVRVVDGAVGCEIVDTLTGMRVGVYPSEFSNEIAYDADRILAVLAGASARAPVAGDAVPSGTPFHRAHLVTLDAVLLGARLCGGEFALALVASRTTNLEQAWAELSPVLDALEEAVR